MTRRAPVTSPQRVQMLLKRHTLRHDVVYGGYVKPRSRRRLSPVPPPRCQELTNFATLVQTPAYTRPLAIFQFTVGSMIPSVTRSNRTAGSAQGRRHRVLACSSTHRAQETGYRGQGLSSGLHPSVITLNGRKIVKEVSCILTDGMCSCDNTLYDTT